MNQQSQKVHPVLRILFLKKWKPNFSDNTIIAFYVLNAILFFVLGGAVFAANKDIQQIVIPYSDQNTLNFTLLKPINPPVFVLYQLDNFYQNNRIYAQSKSNSQLAGQLITNDIAFKNCGNSSYLNQQFIALGYLNSWGGIPLDPKAVASPCGLIAKSFFNDTYTISGPQNKNIFINQTGISWPDDKGKKFKRSPNSESLQWIDPQDQHFINWMRTAGLPNFKKLWGRIESTLVQGQYLIKVKNNYNASHYKSSKKLVITTVSQFGGRNDFEGWAYMAVGAINISVGILFLLKKCYFYQ